MIAADEFIGAALEGGIDFYTGVPCSFLTPLINRVISDARLSYIGATSEGEAVALAAGAWLAGRTTAVMCQNSGLGNAVNPLVSLNYPFRIPTLLVVTLRGEPGLKDEPQHELMGQITAMMLDTLRLPHADFPVHSGDVAPRIDRAVQVLAETSLPYGLLMHKNSVRDDGLVPTGDQPSGRGSIEDFSEHVTPPTRFAAIERSLAVFPESTVVIATTGKCGRELFTLADRPQHLYVVGSMGCASAIGLGIASNSERLVVVLDGDGAALMKLGNMTTVGAQHPPNFLHIILDNGVHDSTGGQATVSPGVDFASVAAACGYASGFTVDSLRGLEGALRLALGRPGPHLIRARIRPGSIEALGRPTISPHDVARRFRAFLNVSEGVSAAGKGARLRQRAQERRDRFDAARP
jgi:phosphonopyruvate decarboxylase